MVYILREYSNHYRWHDMTDVPANSHIMNCELLNVWVVKYSNHKIRCPDNYYKDPSVLNAKQKAQLKENTFCFEQLMFQCVHKIVATALGQPGTISMHKSGAGHGEHIVLIHDF